jgi:hypothetical protein
MARPRAERARVGALALVLLAAPIPAQDVLRLERASGDGAGGGVAESARYRVVVAYGQPDAGPASSGGRYAFAGGVFAAVPTDVLLRDGFEDP